MRRWVFLAAVFAAAILGEGSQAFGGLLLTGVLTSSGSHRTAEQPRVNHALSTVRNGLIAFDSGRSANNTYVMKPDGSGMHKFIRFGLMPTWSPDGNKLAYVGNHMDVARLYVMNADGSRRHRLRVTLDVSEPAWSPDGKKIAFIGGHGWDGLGPPVTGSIYLVDVNGRNLRRLTRSDSDTDPTWSPDGKLIAYQQTTLSDANSRSNVFVMNADGSAPRNIVAGTQVFGNLAWSPDGTKIAYLASGGQGIFTVNPDGSEKHQLNPVDATSLAWSPDGTELAFEAGSQSSKSIYVMDADGGTVRQLRHFKQHWDFFITIAWQPRRFT